MSLEMFGEMPPGTRCSRERIAFLKRLDAEKGAFVKKCDDDSRLEGAMAGKELELYVGAVLLSHAIIPGLPRFHMTCSEYTDGDPDMLVHTRSYFEGCEDGFRDGYDAGFQAAVDKVAKVGSKKTQAVTGYRMALKQFVEEIKERVEMGYLFEPYLFSETTDRKRSRKAA